MATSANSSRQPHLHHGRPNLTLSIPRIKNTLDEGTTETVIAIAARPEGNEVRDQSDGPGLEAKVQNAEAEPNKKFTKSLTPLSD